MIAAVPKKRRLSIGMAVGSPFHRFYKKLIDLQALRRIGAWEREAQLLDEAQAILDEMTPRERVRAEEEWWRASPEEYDAVRTAEEAEYKDASTPKGPCRNCGARQATTWWVGDGGALAWAHGMGQPWCEVCCNQKQIEFAEEAVARLPKLRLDAERMKLLEVLGRKLDTHRVLASGDDIHFWEEPCPKCGSHYVLEIEVNDDYPEASEHSYFACQGCGETR